jgi:hypothetical protein
MAVITTLVVQKSLLKWARHLPKQITHSLKSKATDAFFCSPVRARDQRSGARARINDAKRESIMLKKFGSNGDSCIGVCARVFDSRISSMSMSTGFDVALLGLKRPIHPLPWLISHGG